MIYPDYRFLLKDVIAILKANITELKSKHASSNENEKGYIDARLFSYQEIVSRIRNQIKVYNITPEEIGLNEIEEFF